MYFKKRFFLHRSLCFHFENVLYTYSLDSLFHLGDPVCTLWNITGFQKCLLQSLRSRSKLLKKTFIQFSE